MSSPKRDLAILSKQCGMAGGTLPLTDGQTKFLENVSTV